MTDPAATALPRAASGPAPVVVEALLVGRVAPLGVGVLSAIDKHRVDVPLALGASGLQGDEQADRRHHGGDDKALHHVAAEHYAWWAGELPGVDARRWVPGAFGENLSTCGMTEHEVCVGDRYALGDAQVEVSQARQPCWKLNLRFDVADMARRVQACRRTGWYYRVRREGVVAAGDTLRLLERPARGGRWRGCCITSTSTRSTAPRWPRSPRSSRWPRRGGSWHAAGSTAAASRTGHGGSTAERRRRHCTDALVGGWSAGGVNSSPTSTASKR